ncbi:MAG: hypothetical protein JRG68_09875 [Deltaproteobacteria bacterium]|nr:hypothetical protein [Deltaproteobacteria bacterium]
MALTGCTGLIPIPTPQTQASKPSPPPQSKAPKVEIPDESMEKPSPSPRALASLQLTDQGRMLLNNDREPSASTRTMVKTTTIWQRRGF